MKKVLCWFEEHLILTWAIASVIYAIVIHILFSISISNTWFQAKWSAGEILTYVSTVALGLLAVWQNKKFKEENDVSQERLEKLTVRANELTVISKIIEIENDNLARLRMVFDEFSNACDPQVLTVIYVTESNSQNPSLAISAKMTSAEKRIDDSFFALCRELRVHPKIRSNDQDPLKVALRNYYFSAKELVKKVIASPLVDSSNEVGILTQARNAFLVERENHLIRTERKLRQAIYGTMTLDEIKAMYSEDTTKENNED